MPEYHSRLPHFHPEDAYLFLTWRRWGSLPRPGPHTAYPTAGHAFVNQDRSLDRAGSGPRWLLDPRIADPVAVLMRWLKGSTGRSANQVLGRTGQPFWQDESWDHYLRRANQIGRGVAYIEANPVSAGLAGSAESWRWSSAGWQAEPPAPPNLLNRAEM